MAHIEKAPELKPNGPLRYEPYEDLEDHISENDLKIFIKFRANENKKAIFEKVT